MYWLYLDEVLNNSILNKRVEIFSESFTHHSGLLQNTGGIQRLFYNTGKDIATVKTGKSVKKLFQQGNIGIVQYVENGTVINQYFKISGLNIEYPKIFPDYFSEFGYLPVNKDDGFIFEPGDNKICIRRTEDFEIVSEVTCNLVSSQTTVFYSNAGIILWESERVFLVNQQK